MLRPPCAYSHQPRAALHSTSATTISLSYLEQWKQKKNNQNHVIVFDAVWWNSNTMSSSNQHLLLLACTNTGEIIVWKQASQDGKETNTMDHDDAAASPAESSLQSNEKMDLSEAPSRRMSTTPLTRVQISTGVLYSMKMVTLPSLKTVLMVSGDEGILILDWSTWWANTSHMDTSSSSATSVDTTLPRLARYQTYPSPHEGACVEINDFDLLLQSQYVMGAAGDAFGAYKWNLETQQLVATFPSALQSSSRTHHHGSHPYTHSIKTLHSNNHAKDDKLVLMGGEGGLLSLWDGQQDARIEQWNLGTTTTTSSGSAKSNSAWISSIETLSDDTWWMAGGGISAGSSPNVGFWSAFHGPTRSRITVPSSTTISPHHTLNKNQAAAQPQSHPQQQYTRAPITKMVATESTASWYSVGLEGVVRQWSLSSSLEGYHDNRNHNNSRGMMGRRPNNHYNMEGSDDTSAARSKAVWCDLPCAYAIACSSSHEHRYDDDDDLAPMVAIGGVGPVVNVFKDYNGVLVADQSLSVI